MRTIIFLLLVHRALCAAITSTPCRSSASVATATLTIPPSTTSDSPLSLVTSIYTNVKLQDSQQRLSALVTIAPLLPNPLEKRQKCFDDRGFSVNCATWTGYYYTWGPPGNPYQGGPGDGNGGGGGNSGGGAVVVYQGTGFMSSVNWSMFLGLIGLTLLLFV